MGDAGPRIVDETLTDQQIRIPGRGEDLADGERDGRTVSNLAEQRLILHWHAVLEPEQVVRLQRPAQLHRLGRSEPVMRVVQQDQFLTELIASRLKDTRYIAQIDPRIPAFDLGCFTTRRRLVL